jgi:hypothetical protein
MNDDIIQKSIEAYELASRRDLTVSFARSSILRSILSADEPEKAEMALVIERKGIILGKGLQGYLIGFHSALLNLLLSVLII